jgi:hypothetical protein
LLRALLARELPSRLVTRAMDVLGERADHETKGSRKARAGQATPAKPRHASW